jgi:uncharacterized protein (DUF608 family)
MAVFMSESRRTFLRQTALAAGLAAPLAEAQTAHRATHTQPSTVSSSTVASTVASTPASGGIAYPRVFEGRQLAMIGFPLGGVGAGSISLGGRGQLRDWEIFNRPSKGYAPSYAFPSIRVESLKDNHAVSRVLESRILPPYEGQDGLGAANVPGLPRLETARFTGEFPLAHIDFEDRTLPVSVSLDAFTPFIPHNADDSGLPVAILRYTVHNPGPASARVSIAWSVNNTVHANDHRRGVPETAPDDGRLNTFLTEGRLAGITMSNPKLPANHPWHGTFVLGVLDASEPELSHVTGWPRGAFWNSALLFWDQFSAAGQLGETTPVTSPVGSLCISREVDAGASEQYTFLMAWHFPNRTPDLCGWESPPGLGGTVIGNWYSLRFRDAWEAAAYTAQNLERLEKSTRAFASAIRESDLPAAVKDAATANLSTLVSTTCFRTSDGEFHAFEGSEDNRGSCFGNCAHVWSYETATAFLFPSLAHSMRRAAFGGQMDENGAIHFRQRLPENGDRFPWAAADGQMGHIIHAYLDWKLSGDALALNPLWPKIKKALEFAWTPGSWDANRDGVMEGAQHNTYDVEFYGPNPLCGIYYLAGLRAAEEMGRFVGDDRSADEYRRLFEAGSKWIDANLFNGEYYIQDIQGMAPDRIAPVTRTGVGGYDPRVPEFQVGHGCLVDQLNGQYLAQIAGLGPLLDPAHVHTALQSIYRYNYKRSLADHDCIQRAFALNDEKALVICDYAKSPRPRIPFPYFGEVMTGFEYATSAHMISVGMVREGVECIGNIRARFDGEKRNPWDESEAGHHYARAMASWSAVVALAGFHYDGAKSAVRVEPLAAPTPNFRCFWSNGTGWGTYTLSGGTLAVHVIGGQLDCASCEFPGSGSSLSSAALAGAPVTHTLEGRVFRFNPPLEIKEAGELRLALHG